MKIDARRVDAVLHDPGALRVILLFGDDAGLIRERGATLTRAVAGSLDDPFRVVELGRDGTGRLVDEVSSVPMTGGRRVVRVRDAGEGLAKTVELVLARSLPGLLILEAEGLAARGKLRGLVERAEGGAAIGCYGLAPEAVERLVRETLAARRVSADEETLRFVAGQLGGDVGVSRQEIDKLALYAGEDGRIDIRGARLCVGDLAGLSIDDALFAATAGDVGGTDRALELALADGAAPVSVLRTTLSHLQRLQRAQAAMSAGQSAADAAKQARPPVFFQRLAGFQQALRLWSAESLDAACARIWEAEKLCKQNGTPAEALCRSAVLGLAQRGSAARRNRG